MKFLLVLLVVVIGIWLLLGRSRSRGAMRDDAQRERARVGAQPGAQKGGGPQPMLRCAHCGLHLPANETVQDGTHVYCSEAHRALGPRAADDA